MPLALFTNGLGPYGSDVTSPDEDDVRDGVQYGEGGTEFTGTLALPAEADVRSGVQYGGGGTESTGTLSPVNTQLVVSHPRVVR